MKRYHAMKQENLILLVNKVMDYTKGGEYNEQEL